MAARPPPPLPDEIVEEILVRVPPDDPARLVRAALACKRWRRLVSGPSFRRRFREVHPTPPVLGFLRSGVDADGGGGGTVRFIPAWSSRRPRADRRAGWRALDSRNGSVLLHSDPCRPWHDPAGAPALAVWDPVADELRELPALPDFPGVYAFKAAVLCAECCDHLNCRREPFVVVIVAARPAGSSAYLYTSEADAWSEPTSAPHSVLLFEGKRSAHAGNALYFVFTHIVLMTAEGGGLGCLTIKGSGLHLWLWEADPNGDMRWAQSRVIEHETLVPEGAFVVSFDVVGFADGGGMVYLGTKDGFYIADLKSRCLRKAEGVNGMDEIMPYISFYTPGTPLLSL
ncbi:hypothetical protein GQ55_2G058000 [Panicum hallii var. hallii]|uniref:F-box domain-containing protein n=1 Tax=Panicum hallii var. hallii TaxID=1504633 RepID=A0A2T7ELU8_9POAL|nr:hypothetical protein GQ55_2G058000 [Panicum hallii var. hallii]